MVVYGRVISIESTSTFRDSLKVEVDSIDITAIYHHKKFFQLQSLKKNAEFLVNKSLYDIF